MSDRRIPFTPEDEDRIASAALWGIIAAVTGIVASLVKTGYAVMQYLQLHKAFPMLAKPWGAIVQGVGLVITVLLGVWLIQACTSFRAVARTDVADKAYLLRGFDKLYAYFLTIGVLMIIALALGAALIVLVLMFRPTRTFSFGF
jgi:hypothetical protein